MVPPREGILLGAVVEELGKRRAHRKRACVGTVKRARCVQNVKTRPTTDARRSSVDVRA